MIKARTTALLLLLTVCSYGQYRFEGQVSKAFADQAVYLSLIEDYKKSSRIQLDQLVQKTVADSMGYFVFEGKNLPPANRIYRIHTDGCDLSTTHQNHILGNCQQSKSVLFIANNSDRIFFERTDDQEMLCSVHSDGGGASYLLEVETLKEAMAYELSEITGEKGRQMVLAKWFEQLQSFGQLCDEPLVELFIHDFLSDRRSETREFYLNDLSQNPYYDNLMERLQLAYPEARFTTLFRNELDSDRYSISKQKAGSGFAVWGPYAALVLSVLLNLFLLYRLRKRPGPANFFEKLTEQEQKIITYIEKGHSNKEIAAALFISHSTVKTHINNLYKKLGVSSRDELLGLFD